MKKTLTKTEAITRLFVGLLLLSGFCACFMIKGGPVQAISNPISWPTLTPTKTVSRPISQPIQPIVVKIRAWGDAAPDPKGGYFPTMLLTDGSQILGTYNVTASSKWFAQTFTYIFPEGKTFTGKPIVRYINDYCPTNNCTAATDRNLYVDWIEINGIKYQTEDPRTYSLGSWTTGNRCGLGYQQQEVLACSGWFRFDQYSK